MVQGRGTIQSFAGALVSAALVLAISGCAAASPSASSLPSANSTAPSPTTAATASVVPSYPPDPGGDSFAILPAHQPAGFSQKITCTGLIGATDPVALVRLQEKTLSFDVVLRDYADTAHPRTACTFVKGQNWVTQVIDARHAVIQAQVSGGSGNPYTYAVVDLPEVTFHWFELSVVGEMFPMFIAVSPGLDQIAWLTRDPLGSGTDSIHISTRAGDHVVATVPDTNAGRCGTGDDSKTGDYTRSGDRLYVLDQPFPEQNSLSVIEGETPVLSILPPSAGWVGDAFPAMALWSPTTETLYYRKDGDIWHWTAGADPGRFLTGVTWSYATISADGAHLAYQVNDAGGPHVYLVDLAHEGGPKLIGKGARKWPVFVNATQLWFRSLGTDHGCAGTEEEKPLIYNVLDGSEAPSIIDQVWMVWPATSSNY